MGEELYIGLMSGTSIDGIDAALVAISDEAITSLASHSLDFPSPLRKQLLSLCKPGENEIERMSSAGIELAELSAEAIRQLLAKSTTQKESVRAIGSHGQTIRHKPDAKNAFSLQIGDPSTLAHLTGITTVADFRMADIAAGGQGAPLVPAFHQAVFAADEQPRVILNIGGIANITFLPPQKSAEKQIEGYDTGPGNMLMDLWIGHSKNSDYDDQGKWARSGKIDTELLTRFNNEPYLLRPSPKSTGRELFNWQWLEKHIAQHTLAAEDIQRTLLEFTASSIATSIQESTEHAGCEVFVCGGGIRNTFLMERLQGLLLDYSIRSTQELGIDPQLVEACAFAWLAKRSMHRMHGNAKAVTGANVDKILGGIYPA